METTAETYNQSQHKVMEPSLNEYIYKTTPILEAQVILLKSGKIVESAKGSILLIGCLTRPLCFCIPAWELSF